jgi:large subunit ribosomal protein L13
MQKWPKKKPIFHSHKNFSIVNTLSFRTRSVNKHESTKKWYVVDAENQEVGRICSRIASVLRGKHTPAYTPNADCGDFVVVINADKIRFTGKKWQQKEYKDNSLHPGGQRLTVAETMKAKQPHRVIERAVRGMLPKTKLGDALYTKLFVYAGDKHPHAAQKPEPFTF